MSNVLKKIAAYLIVFFSAAGELLVAFYISAFTGIWVIVGLAIFVIPVVMITLVFAIYYYFLRRSR